LNILLLYLKYYFDIIELPHYGRKGVDYVEKTFIPALLLKRFICVIYTEGTDNTVLLRTLYGAK